MSTCREGEKGVGKREGEREGVRERERERGLKLVSGLCRSNTNINDVLGDYCLTLVDALDTLAVSNG